MSTEAIQQDSKSYKDASAHEVRGVLHLTFENGITEEEMDAVLDQLQADGMMDGPQFVLADEREGVEDLGPVDYFAMPSEDRGFLFITATEKNRALLG